MDTVWLWAIVAVIGVGIVVGAVALTGRSRRIRRAKDRQRLEAADAEIARRAGLALVSADERIRLSEDERAFAVAEFGDQAAAPFGVALHEARSRLREAFHLNQLLSDHIPESDAERRSMNERIVELCESSEPILRQHNSAFTARRAAGQRVPETIARVRAEAATARASIQPMHAKLVTLAERYADEALSPMATNAAQAEQLLDFVERSLSVAEQRAGAGQTADAGKAIQIATESVKRAAGLTGSIDAFEVEALRAETTLSAMLADSINDLAEARGEATTPDLSAAITRLDQAVADVSGPLERRDPFSALSRLREANAELDRAREAVRARRDDTERIRSQLVTALGDAERQIAAAQDLVMDHRAPIGPDARTRLAEAQRILENITEERDPATALHLARRSATLAAEAQSIAREDLARPALSGGLSPRAGGALTGVIGGLVIGGLLDGFDGVEDLFD